MAVYTHVSDDDARVFVGKYDIGLLVSLTPIAEGVENTNYLLTTTAGKFILTLFEKRTRTEDLPFFISAMAHMARHQIPAPRPILQKNGDYLGRLCGRSALIVSFLGGKPINGDASDDACFQLGVMLAEMHLAAGSFEKTRENPLSISGWRKLFEQCGARINERGDGLHDLVGDELAYLEQNWPCSLDAGLIHADLFPDNVLFDDGNVSGVIDFYFSCTDFFAYDLAICINAWCARADGSIYSPALNALLKGYLSRRALSQDEFDALPVFVRGAALRFLLTRLYDWLNRSPNAIVNVKDPLPYAEILRRHQSTNLKSLIS